MQTKSKWWTLRPLCLALSLIAPAVAQAQDAADNWPNKPVRVLVAQAPGGTDVQARLYALKLADRFGSTFLIENRPGRNIAWTMTARAPADGYTLLVAVPDFTFAPALYKDLPVDPVKDFTPVSLMSRAPFFLAVNATTVPAKTLKEFIALARANPGKFNFGAGLPGVGTHLTSVLFMTQANIKAAYVPYKGVAQAVVDLLAGQIDATVSTGVSVGQHMKSGRLRGLGVTAGQRSREFPDVPTMAEQGVQGVEVQTFHGWVGPAAIPGPILAKLSGELQRIARMPDVVEKLQADNAEPVGSTAEEFGRFIATEVPRWRKLVQESGIVVNN
jgi:tripartite-type tricarboxylate transporter receptor subunit TctC